jgi:hypothetical protein
MQRAEDLGQPLQVAVEGRRGVLGADGGAKAGKYGKYGEEALGHSAVHGMASVIAL